MHVLISTQIPRILTSQHILHRYLHILKVDLGCVGCLDAHLLLRRTAARKLYSNVPVT